MDERNNRPDPRHGYQNQTHEEQFARRFSVEHVDAEEDTEGTDNPADDPQREPTPPEALMRAWEQITEHSNAVMAFFTILIFVATTAYAVIASLQWCVMRTQSSILQNQLEMSERPWIIVFGPYRWFPITFNNGTLRLPTVLQVTNNGHSQAIGLKFTHRMTFLEGQ